MTQAFLVFFSFSFFYNNQWYSEKQQTINQEKLVDFTQHLKIAHSIGPCYTSQVAVTNIKPNTNFKSNAQTTNGKLIFQTWLC